MFVEVRTAHHDRYRYCDRRYVMMTGILRPVCSVVEQIFASVCQWAVGDVTMKMLDKITRNVEVSVKFWWRYILHLHAVIRATCV